MFRFAQDNSALTQPRAFNQGNKAEMAISTSSLIAEANHHQGSRSGAVL
jgi:hypothetical protein